MSIAAALIYWVIVTVWLVVLATIVLFYIRNPRAFGTTRLLLAVIGIDTIRNIVENVYFGLYFGGQYGLFSSEISKLLGNPYLLIVPKLINVAAQAETGARNLCLPGGVALNCVANGKVLREGIFDDIWIQPVDGGALGAALATYRGRKGRPRRHR